MPRAAILMFTVFGSVALAASAHAQAKKPAAAPTAGTKTAATSAPPTETPVSAPGAAPASAEPGRDPQVKVERGAGGRKVYRITEEIKIEGKIQKPEAFYVLQKSGINYDWQELRQDFIPKILDSVSKAPF